MDKELQPDNKPTFLQERPVWAEKTSYLAIFFDKLLNNGHYGSGSSGVTTRSGGFVIRPL